MGAGENDGARRTVPVRSGWRRYARDDGRNAADQARVEQTAEFNTAE
jgi:hypothetical protein